MFESYEEWIGSKIEEGSFKEIFTTAQGTGFDEPSDEHEKLARDKFDLEPIITIEKNGIISILGKRLKGKPTETLAFYNTENGDEKNIKIGKTIDPADVKQMLQDFDKTIKAFKDQGIDF